MITIDSWNDFNNNLSERYCNLHFTDNFIKNHFFDKNHSNSYRVDLHFMITSSSLSNESIFWLLHNQQFFNKGLTNLIKEVFYNLFRNEHFYPDDRLIKHFNLKQLQIDIIRELNYWNDMKFLFPETKEYIKLITL